MAKQPRWQLRVRWPRFASVFVMAMFVAVDSSTLHHKAVGAGGDAVRGAALFAKLPCTSCHDITKPWPGGDICPNLGNIATEAARIVRLQNYRGKARDAAGYIRESIIDPNAYIVPGMNYRTPDGQSVMPKDFGRSLTASQVDDIVAFLLTKQ